MIPAVLILAAVWLVFYVAYCAVVGHARRVERDQAELAAYKPLGHGEPSRAVEESRWDTRVRNEDGRP